MRIKSVNTQQKTSISQRDIWQARQRILPFVKQSPLVYSEAMSRDFGSDFYLKLEQFNPSNSFKIRGAANKILSLSEDEKANGVTTFSTGNFGRSVAYVANLLGVKAVICISANVPDAKADALEQTGAEVMKVGTSQGDAETFCYQLEQDNGYTVIHPFDDPYVISGQGTIGLEILEDVPDVDTVIAGLSGGGLHAGLGVALKNAGNALRLVGVSAEQGAAMHASIQAGKPVQVKENDTLADSLLGGIGMNNQYTFEMVQHYVDEITLLNEQVIAGGMRYVFDREQMTVEGAAAAGVGAIKHGKIAAGKKNVIVLTGRSVGAQTIVNLMLQFEI